MPSDVKEHCSRSGCAGGVVDNNSQLEIRDPNSSSISTRLVANVRFQVDIKNEKTHDYGNIYLFFNTTSLDF